MPERERHIRHGFAAVRPYLHGHLDLADFVWHAFGVLEIERVEAGLKPFHIESQIGDSVAVLENGGSAPCFRRWCFGYVYVEDVDATYNTIARPTSAPRRLVSRRTNLIRSAAECWIRLAIFGGSRRFGREALALCCGYNFKAEFPPPSFSSMLSMPGE